MEVFQLKVTFEVHKKTNPFLRTNLILFFAENIKV